MKGPYTQLRAIQKSHGCAVCGDQGHLEIAWRNGADVLWCPRCGAVDGFQRRKSITQMWRENPDSVPVQIGNRLADKHHDDIEAVAEGLPPELGQAVRDWYLPRTEMPRRNDRHDDNV